MSNENQVSYSTANMGTYKAKQIKKNNKGSRTPGRTKGASCQATPLQRALARNSRSYKHPQYNQMCKYWDGLNNRSGLGKQNG